VAAAAEGALLGLPAVPPKPESGFYGAPIACPSLSNRSRSAGPGSYHINIRTYAAPGIASYPCPPAFGDRSPHTPPRRDYMAAGDSFGSKDNDAHRTWMHRGALISITQCSSTYAIPQLDSCKRESVELRPVLET